MMCYGNWRIQFIVCHILKALF